MRQPREANNAASNACVSTLLRNSNVESVRTNFAIRQRTRVVLDASQASRPLQPTRVILPRESRARAMFARRCS